MYGRKSGAKMQILVDSLLFYRVVRSEIQKIWEISSRSDRIDRWIFGELGTFFGNPSRYVGSPFCDKCLQNG